MSLDGLLTPPPLSQPSQGVRFRQGLVVSFDPDTLSNVVNVGGTLLTDLPLLGIAEAASIAEGSVVGLLAMEGTTGMATYAIVGLFVTPNTAAATDAITRLSQNIVTSTVAALESTSSATYTDLTTPGPSVTIRVKASGRVLVYVSCQTAVENKQVAMSFDMAGANVAAASDDTSFLFGHTVSSAGENSVIFATRLAELHGLNPGLTTFTAKYRMPLRIGGSATASFFNRNLTVFAI